MRKLKLTSLLLLTFFAVASLAGVWSGDAFDGDNENGFDAYSEPIPGTDVSIKMVPVPGGTFRMGSPEGEAGRSPDEGPPHRVRVDSFWIGAYEITWDQYNLFVTEEIGELRKQLPATSDDGAGQVEIKADAVTLPTPPYVDMSFGMGKEGFPAVNMTHYAAVMYARWLTAKTGRFYRLPTEAEWEYACRAGAGTAYHFGDNPQKLNEYAWFKGNSNRKYHKVGTKKPNPLGLYDMHGNVAEWTMDQYVEEYFSTLEGTDEGVAVNPWIRPDELYPRSLRGGSWIDEAAELRCAERRGSNPRWKRRDPQLPKSRWWFTDAPFLGFRVVRPEETPDPKEMEKYWIEAIDDYGN